MSFELDSEMVEVTKIGSITRLAILLWVIVTIAVLPLTGTPAARYSDRNAAGNVALLRTFELGTGDAVLCYDDRPAFVFASTGADGPHAILLVPFDGEAKEIFNVSGKILAGTLSCSDDGQTIAFVRDNAQIGDFDLFIVRSGVASQYHLSAWSNAFPIEGTTSLLSEDGVGIALPARPVHVAGPDVIEQMHGFIYDGKPYFSNGSLIYDHGRFIEGLSFTGDYWETKFTIGKDSALFIEQAGYCFGHTIAVGAVDESESAAPLLYDLTRGKLDKVRLPGFSNFAGHAKQLKLGSLLTSASRYERCIYAFANWENPRYILGGLATVDRYGSHYYKITKDLMSGEDLTLASFRIGITKDGCSVLASTFLESPRVAQDFSKPTRVLALRLESKHGSCP